MLFHCLRALGLLCAVWILGLSQTSSAQRRTIHHIQSVRPEVHLDVGFHGFLGAGFDISIPIVPDGFLSNIDDELAIVPGLDFLFFDFHHDGPRGFGFAPNVTAQWNLYVSRRWSVFPELGVVVLITTEENHRYFHGYGKKAKHVYADPVGAFGARFHFSDRSALVFRIGYPFGGQIGITF